MSKSHASGFTVVEVLLVLIFAAIIGFTGYYVWHARQATNEALNAVASSNSTASSSDKTSPKIASADETASWLVYQSPGKEYSIRLADGWKLNHCNGTGLLYTHKHTDVSPIPGTRAVVTDVDCGSDGGGDGLFINFLTNASDAITHNPRVSTFKTNAGETVTLYSRIEDSSAGGLGSVDKGGIYYTYILEKSPTKIMYIDYGVNPGQSDDHTIIEKSIKTIIVY